MPAASTETPSDLKAVPAQLRESSSHSEDTASNLALPWVVRLRYGMILGELTIVLGMKALFGLEVPLLWALAPLAVMLSSNA